MPIKVEFNEAVIVLSQKSTTIFMNIQSNFLYNYFGSLYYDPGFLF